MPDGATAFKCAPHREPRAASVSWHGLRGACSTWSSRTDSPCTPELKKLVPSGRRPGPGEGDFDAAWGGIASLQMGCPSCGPRPAARGRGRGRLALDERGREAAGLARKGVLEAGRDADLVVWRPDETFDVSAQALEHRTESRPTRAETLHGVVAATYLRGARTLRGEKTHRGRWLRGQAS